MPPSRHSVDPVRIATWRLVGVMHWTQGMKPLTDMTAMNDEGPAKRLTEERARRREGRDRHPKGPVWAVAIRDVDAA